MTQRDLFGPPSKPPAPVPELPHGWEIVESHGDGFRTLYLLHEGQPVSAAAHYTHADWPPEYADTTDTVRDWYMMDGLVRDEEGDE